VEPSADQDWPLDRDDASAIGPRPSRRPLLWAVSLALAWLVFELTAEPALSVAVGSLKFAGDGMRAAIAAYRAEPDRTKGRAEASFLIAWGLWQSTGMALLLMVGIAFGDSWIVRFFGMPPIVEAPLEFVTAALVTVLSIALATVASLVAIVEARRGRVRVWIGRSRNRVPMIATLGLLGIIFSASAAVLWAPMVSPPEADWWIPAMIAVELGYFCLALPMGVLWARDALVRRITARWPGDSSEADPIHVPNLAGPIGPGHPAGDREPEQ
jgi:hypothetical protein